MKNKLMKKAILYPILFAVLISIFTVAVKNTFFTKKNYKILFVMYGAGETTALKPLMEKLDANKINYRVLVMSTARNLIEDKRHVIDINTQCKIEPFIDRENWKRENVLEDIEIQKLMDCVDSEIIITGVVSRVQQQIANAFKQKGSDVIAYYDMFRLPADDSISFSFLNDISTLWVSTSLVKDKFKSKKRDLNVQIVGQPVISKWIETVNTTNKDELKNKIGIDNQLPIVVYAGGVGNDYENAFDLFTNIAKNFVGKYNVLLSLHPKTDGLLEKQILLKNNIANIVIVPKSVGTNELAAIADLLVCYRSTVGTTSFFAGKNAIYLDIPGTTYSDFVIDNGWVPQVTNEKDFMIQFDKLIGKSSVDVDTDSVYKKGDIPSNSVDLMYGILLDKL